MKNPLQLGSCVLLAVTLNCCPSGVSAQELAYGKDTNPPQEGSTRNGRNTPLKKVLTQLESRYKVHFAFEKKIVDGKYVDADGLPAQGLEATLDGLLTPLHLRYKKLDGNLFVIQPDADVRSIVPVKEGSGPQQPETNAGNSTSFLNPVNIQLMHNTIRRIDVTVTGRVTDEQGAGLPGVTVLVKGTTTGTATDADGNFTITAPDPSATLTFSYIGYVTQDVPINNRTSINVTMATDVQALSEVVVIGYGTQERTDLTGSVASVSAADIQRAPVSTVNEAIQGRVPGVTITSSGTPGQASNINIRGIGSLNAGSGPLYVIDGVWTDNLRDFNPQDIESLQVLKDAATTAIYGARGANGVVIITTKRGKAGTTAINFNAYAGVQNVVKRWDLANASQFADITNLAYDNAGRPRMLAADKNRPDGFNPNIDTDWQDALLKTGSVQDYNLSLSGGGENSNFLVSGGYFTQDGTIKGPSFDRYSLRLNTGLTKGRVKIRQSAQVVRSNTVNVNGLPFIDMLRMLPTIPVYDPTEGTGSGYGYGSDRNYTFGTNPVALQEMQRATTLSNRVLGNVEVDFSIFDFLTYRANLGLEYQNYNDRVSRKFGRWRYNEPLDPAFLNEGRQNFLFTIMEHTLSFNRQFGRHNPSAVVGYTEQKNNFEYVLAGTRNFGTGPNYNFVLGSGATTTPTVGGGNSVWAKRSFLGRIMYDFDDRYLFTASIRQDGSSRFPENNRWGTFGAASVGWRISQEDFFANVPLVSNLKLRASYGVNGNDALPSNLPYIGGFSLNSSGDYLYQGIINTNANYVLGGGQDVIPGSIQTTLASENIKWESRYTTNFGFDLGLLEDRLTLSADYYISKTRDALVNPLIPLYLGNFGGNPFINLGELENRGFEFVLGFNENRNDFRYGITANLTTIRNEVLALATEGQIITGGPHGGITRTEVGQPVGSFYLLQTDGIFQTPEEVTSHNFTAPDGTTRLIQPYAKPGDVRYKDIDRDGAITDRDRSYVGSPIPKVQYGLNLTSGYRNFDLSIFFQGVAGNKVWNGPRFWLDRLDDVGNYRTDLNPWTGPGTSNSTPRPLISGSPNPDDAVAASQNARADSDRWLESGSYLRLKNIQLGYTLPAGVLGGVKWISSLRVYLTGQNVFTITPYTGLDPETVGSGFFARGVDDGSYPNLRTFTGGIQLGF